MQTRWKFGYSAKIMIFLVVLGGIVLGGRAKEVRAESYRMNYSTEAVASYQGCGASHGYYGRVGYVNIWDSDRSNKLKQASYTVRKNGQYVQSNSYTANNYMNYCAFPVTIYGTGQYVVSVDITTTDGNSATGDWNFYVYDIMPVISTNPSSASVKEGAYVSFSTSISQGTNVNYQWQYSSDGGSTYNVISGATSAVYTIPSNSVKSSLNGRYYRCRLGNDNDEGKYVYTTSARLTVYSAPSITVPAAKSVQEGTSATFSVSATGGNPSSYSYQWYHASTFTGIGTKIAGATSSSYTIPAREVAASLDGYFFYCIVSNGIYEVTSNRAKLTVIKNTSPVIPVTAVVMDNAQLSLKEGETGQLSASVQPGNAINRTVTWSSTNSGVALVQAENENAAVMAVSEGTAVITAVAGGKTARCTVTVSPKDNPQQPEGKELSVTTPADQSVKAESSAVFTVSASGGDSPDYEYQWYYALTSVSQGIPIDGAVMPSYTIPAREVTASLDGYFFYCVVRSGSKQAVSGRAKLTVIKDQDKNLGDSAVTTNPDGSGGGSNTTNPSGGAAAKPEAPVKLTAPKLKAKLASPTAVRLSWNKVKNASAYTIYRATSQKGKYKKITSTKKTSYTDKKVKSGKTYYYKAQAYKGKIKSSFSSAVEKKIPQKPGGVKLELAAAGGNFTLTWKSVKHADKVEIWMQIDGGKWKKWKALSVKKKKYVYSYNNINWSKKCAFKLRAYSKKDGVALYGSYSNVMALTKK